MEKSSSANFTSVHMTSLRGSQPWLAKQLGTFSFPEELGRLGRLQPRPGGYSHLTCGVGHCGKARPWEPDGQGAHPSPLASQLWDVSGVLKLSVPACACGDHGANNSVAAEGWGVGGVRCVGCCHW